jgi:hypothetical protein
MLDTIGFAAALVRRPLDQSPSGFGSRKGALVVCHRTFPNRTTPRRGKDSVRRHVDARIRHGAKGHRIFRSEEDENAMRAMIEFTSRGGAVGPSPGRCFGSVRDPSRRCRGRSARRPLGGRLRGRGRCGGLPRLALHPRTS